MLELDYLEETDYPDDDYDDTPTSEQITYAESLVGKYCVTVTKNTCTPFLDNLLCKVVEVNDNRKGGNRSQVLIRVYRNKLMWGFGGWWVIGTGRGILECVASSHLTETPERPTIKEYIVSSISIVARIITASLSTEHKSFKYGWWHEEYMWRHITPLSSLLAAICDIPRAFKHGVYISYYI